MLNCLSHNVHWYGLSPLWRNLCAFRLPILLKGNNICFTWEISWIQCKLILGIPFQELFLVYRHTEGTNKIMTLMWWEGQNSIGDGCTHLTACTKTRMRRRPAQGQFTLCKHPSVCVLARGLAPKWGRRVNKMASSIPIPSTPGPGGGSPIEKVYGEAMNKRPPFLSPADIGKTPLFIGDVRQAPTFQ